jgi:phage portal protein BeeE
MVCACLHVDPWMIGIGPMPNHSNVEAMQQVYLAKCLMVHVKSFQACLSDGLELPRLYAVHFDLDDLLLMDSQTKMGVLQQGVGAGVLTPNEARARVNLPPKPGGDDPYLQQQYWPLEALTDRTTTPAPPARPTETSSSEDEDLDEDAITEKAMVLARRR